jgi:hypothetical protein
VRDELSPRGYMKYAPDSHFVFTSYVVLSLLKVGLPHEKFVCYSVMYYAMEQQLSYECDKNKLYGKGNSNLMPRMLSGGKQ